MRPSRIAVVALIAACAGCVSPGKRYDTLDIRFLNSPTATPPQPTTTQAATITATLFDTSVKHRLDGVVWRAYVDPTIPSDPLTPVDPTTGTLVGSGTVDLPADGTAVATLTPGVVAPGIHSYYFVADPDNAIAERDETDNVASITVATADLDVAYAATPSFPTTEPDGSGNVVMDFSLINNPNPGLADPTTGPTANVSFTIYENYVSAAQPGTVVPIVAGPTQPIAVAPQATVPVSVTIAPAIGPHAFTVVFTSDVAESNVDNDVSTITVGIGTGG